MTEEQLIDFFMHFFVSSSGWILGTSTVGLISLMVASHLRKSARRFRKEGLEFSTMMYHTYKHEWEPAFKMKVQSWLRTMMYFPKQDDKEGDDNNAT